MWTEETSQESPGPLQLPVLYSVGEIWLTWFVSSSGLKAKVTVDQYRAVHSDRLYPVMAVLSFMVPNQPSTEQMMGHIFISTHFIWFLPESIKKDSFSMLIIPTTPWYLLLFMLEHLKFPPVLTNTAKPNILTPLYYFKLTKMFYWNSNAMSAVWLFLFFLV